MKKEAALVPAKKNRVRPASPGVAFRLPKIRGKTPGERINFLHELALASARGTIVACILAGWELCKVRQACGHGSWLLWLQKNTKITERTARNYMAVYAKTIGASRATLPQPLPMETPPTPEEIKAASEQVKANGITALYTQLDLVKPNLKHGGARDGAGRKAKAEEPSAVDVDGELRGEEGRALIQNLAIWALGADDGFGAFPDGQLAAAISTLKAVLARANEILSARRNAR